MYIGILQFEILVPGSRSLKDKRRVVRSVKDRLHRAHQVSVAEVGALDSPTVALMGLTMSSGSGAHAGRVLDGVLGELRELRDGQLGDFEKRICRAQDMPADTRPLEEVVGKVWDEAELEVLEDIARHEAESIRPRTEGSR